MLWFVFFVGAAVYLYRYLRNRLTLFESNGVPGPKAHWLKGSLDTVFGRPNSLIHNEWTRQYGKTYGYYEGARPVLVTSDLHVMQELFVKKFDCFHGRKWQMTSGPPEMSKFPSVFASRGRQWKRYRSIANPLFAMTRLKTILPTFDEFSKTFADQMEKQIGKGPVDLIPLTQGYTLDVILRLTMGQDGSKQGTAEQKDMLKTMKAIFDPDNQIVDSPINYWALMLPELIPMWRWLDKAHKRITTWNAAYKDDHMYREVERRRQNKDNYKGNIDFIQVFLEAETEGIDSRRVTTQETAAMTNLFVTGGFVSGHWRLHLFVTGGFTTSIAVSLVGYFLALHPDVQTRAYDEIVRLIDDHETLTVDTLEKLKYLDAVVRESMRLYPIGSIAAARECQQACTLGGMKIEPGMLVHADLISSHRDPQVWGDDADQFRPERFLESEKRHQLAWMPFGAGPRMCIAQKFAMCEVKTAFCHVLRRCRLVASDQTRKPLSFYGTTLTVLSPTNVFVEVENRHN